MTEYAFQRLAFAARRTNHVYNEDGSDSPACLICQALEQLKNLTTTPGENRMNNYNYNGATIHDLRYQLAEMTRERDELREALTAAEANIAASFDEGPVHTQTYVMDWTPANPTPQTEEK